MSNSIPLPKPKRVYKPRTVKVLASPEVPAPIKPLPLPKRPKTVPKLAKPKPVAPKRDLTALYIGLSLAIHAVIILLVTQDKMDISLLMKTCGL